MAFGFGVGDFGFSEFNPFGVRGRGVAFASPFRRNQGQSFPVAQTPQARTAVGQQPFSSPIGPQPFIGPQQGPQQAPQQAPQPAPQPIAPTAPTAPTQQTPQQVGPSELELRTQEQNQLFQGVFDLLNQRESQLGISQQETLGSIGGQFDALRPLIEQARTSGLEGVAERERGTRRREVNVIADARQNASELRRRNLQLFGGGGAGKAISEIQGRELARGVSGIRVATGENLNALGQQSQDIEANFQGQLQQLETQKQAALQESKQRFQEKLFQLQQQRTQLGGEKTASIIEIARELRAEQFNIEQMDRQFKQGILDQFNQTVFQLRGQQQLSNIEAGRPIDLQELRNFSLSSFGSAQQAPQQEQIQGQIRRRPEEV